jgi:hypothetical protein
MRDPSLTSILSLAKSEEEENGMRARFFPLLSSSFEERTKVRSRPPN